MYPYSDGSPVYEFGVAILITTAFGAVALTPARQMFGVPARQLGNGLRRTGLFSETISLSAKSTGWISCVFSSV
jgi:hypothetical protein